MKKLVLLFSIVTSLGICMTSYAQEVMPTYFGSYCWYESPPEGAPLSYIEIYNGDGSDVLCTSQQGLRDIIGDLQYGKQHGGFPFDVSYYGADAKESLKQVRAYYVNENAYVIAPYDCEVVIGAGWADEGLGGEAYGYAKKGDKIMMLPEFIRYNDFNSCYYMMFLRPTEKLETVVTKNGTTTIKKSLGYIDATRQLINAKALGRINQDWQRDSISLFYASNVSNPEIYPDYKYDKGMTQEEYEEHQNLVYGRGEWIDLDKPYPIYTSPMTSYNVNAYMFEYDGTTDDLIAIVTREGLYIKDTFYKEHDIQLKDGGLYLDGYRLIWYQSYKYAINPDPKYQFIFSN
ncbi:hypothetical protein [Clostridium transplantifaecale]|uniref:hypothetical protein n=1 Tax=Clostridium transplantifaecale TaxID=2479838 RepID=UPI000F634902|nr:hypothetical protein [Clostridium transplantifaecale]